MTGSGWELSGRSQSNGARTIFSSATLLLCAASLKVKWKGFFFFFSKGCSSGSAYILRYYVMIIYLPFLCCQPSSAITTIVINEGSIYQPASARFLFLPSPSPPTLLHLTSAQFILFLHLVSPPLHPAVYPSIHPSIPHSHSARSRLSLCLLGGGWDAACHPGAAHSHPGCWRWPVCCQSLSNWVAEGMGVEAWCGAQLFRNSLFFSSSFFCFFFSN